jgi:cytochrome c oxidase subunit 2
MLADLYVHPTADSLDAWIAKESDLSRFPLHVAGEIIFNRRGCAGCHSRDGRIITGPSFLGLWTKISTGQEHFQDGTSLTQEMIQSQYGGAAENYIFESIRNPKAKIVQGFPDVMPTFQGQLTDADLAALVAFLRWADERQDSAIAEFEAQKTEEPAGG